jgi:hypothetical protein
MKNSLFLFFVSAICFFSAKGQSNVTGKFVDKNNVPIEFLRVSISADDHIVSGAYTDSEGTFTFDAPNGKYIFLATSIFGDTVHRIDTLAISGMLDMGTILLSNNFEKLDEVVVEMRQKLFIRKPDRLIFNVERSISAIGGSALDALAITPGVKVRGSEISIVGKGAVLILLNDQLLKLSGDDLINFLRSISSDDIQTIEVITNPPAKYDADGNNGLINIKLKKVKAAGWNGNARLSYSQATYAGVSTGGNLNYYKNKLTFYTGVNIGSGSIAPISDKSILYASQSWIENNKSRYFHQFLNGRAGVEYALSDKTSFGIKYQGAISNPFIDEKISTLILNPATGHTDSSLLTFAETETQTLDHSINGFFVRNIDTLGKKLSIDMDYFHYSNTSNRSFDYQSYSASANPITALTTQNDVSQAIQVYTSKLDLELPTKMADFNVGAKFTAILNNSDVDFYNRVNGNLEIDILQSSKFTYSEITEALYGSMSKEYNKWQFQLGIRLESTQTEGVSTTLNQKNTNNYFNVFPTAYLVYAPNDSNSFVLNYGRRIDRPPYWRLNPFRQYSSIYAYSEGNPYLQPCYYNNVELTYVFRDNFISTLFYSRTDNKYDQITYVSPVTNLQQTLQKNFLTVTSVGISESYTFDKLDWLESTNEFVVYMNQAVSNDTSTVHVLQGFSSYISTNNSLILNKNKTLFGEVNFYYQFPEVDGVDRLGDYYSLDLGFRWKLLDKRLSISCRAVDILRSDFTKVKSNINQIEQRNKRYWDARQLFVSLNYNFGKSKASVNQRNASNEDERNRVN